MTENKKTIDHNLNDQNAVESNVPIPPASRIDTEPEPNGGAQESIVAEETSKTGTVQSGNQEENLRFAGFWMRLWAYLIDLIVIGSIGRIILKPVLKILGVEDSSSFFSPLTIGSAIIFYLYFVLMTKYFSQTLGKMALGLKVISLKEARLSWGTVIFREFIGRFINRTIIVLYILVGFLPKHQGLHDIFADTSVIHER